MMDILVPETCWGNKTAYFVASGWFFTFTMSTMHGHMYIKRDLWLVLQMKKKMWRKFSVLYIAVCAKILLAIFKELVVVSCGSVKR
jgi:hypothetical protein